MSIVITKGSLAHSTLYGWDGSKEVRFLMKRMRLGRDALRNEGDPLKEHLVLPLAKIDGAVAKGAKQVTFAEFEALQAEKAAKMDDQKVDDRKIVVLTHSIRSQTPLSDLPVETYRRNARMSRSQERRARELLRQEAYAA